MGHTRIHNGWGETMRVGFIGLGAMGSRMAGRLLAAHHDVVVYDRSRENARPLEQRGAKVAATLRELAAGVGIVCSSVTNDVAVEQVMFEPDGVLAAGRAGSTMVDMSTVSPRTSRRLHEAARSKGVAVLDAPVSGSTVQAEQGQLVIFVGGEEDVYKKCQPIRRAGQQDVLSRAQWRRCDHEVVRQHAAGPGGSGAGRGDRARRQSRAAARAVPAGAG